MKNYALLIAIVLCFGSCSPDDSDNDPLELGINRLSQDNPKDTDWDKGK